MHSEIDDFCGSQHTRQLMAMPDIGDLEHSLQLKLLVKIAIKLACISLGYIKSNLNPDF